MEGQAMTTGNFIAYFRVSTDRQGQSGLGLEAQRKGVMDFLNGGNWKLVDEYTEVESGKRNDRPELAAALDACRRQKAKLVIAKLDRLARNVHFISGLMESGVDFVAADMPEANKLTVHIMAAMAEYEREQISDRTKKALAAVKARGKKLGWSMPERQREQRKASRQGVKSNIAHADRFAENTLPIIREIQAAGITTLQGVAEALNARGIRTARGKKWFPGTVKNILARQTRTSEIAADAA
jgi:DNA invertase Pin-like site-specific DNA recombinase